METTKEAFQYSLLGYYQDKVLLTVGGGDFKEGDWVVPVRCTLTPPLDAKEGCLVKWVDSGWIYESIIDEPVNPEIPFTLTQRELLSKLATGYSNELEVILHYSIKMQVTPDRVAITVEELHQDLLNLDLKYSEYSQLILKGIDPWGDPNSPAILVGIIRCPICGSHFIKVTDPCHTPGCPFINPMSV